MLSRMTAFIAALAIMCLATGLQAQVSPKGGNEYPPFVIEIPEGWQAVYKRGSGEVGQSLDLTSPDKAASFSLRIEAIPSGGWAQMIEDMSVRPKPDHGPPNMQDDSSFVVTYNDTATGLTGRKIYRRLDQQRYLEQITLGFHADLPRLINAVEIVEKNHKK